MIKYTLIFTATIILSACGETKLLPVTQADVDRGATKYPGTTLESLNDGKADFQHYCTQCHGLKNPAKKTADQWLKIVPGMTEKAARSATKEKIDLKKKESILRYLVTMSKTASK